jgi:hypothetical protein
MKRVFAIPGHRLQHNGSRDRNIWLAKRENPTGHGASSGTDLGSLTEPRNVPTNVKSDVKGPYSIVYDRPSAHFVSFTRATQRTVCNYWDFLLTV